MQWTDEQQPIIVSEAPKLLIQAGAGSGKTTTLVGYAKHHSQLRILYLCYNKSVEQAARGRFPRNVVNKTAHGLAYAVYGSQYTHKQTNNLRLTDIARAVSTQDWELVRDVLATLNNFMASADAEIGRGHFPRFRDRTMLTSAQERFLAQGLGVARALWTRMKDLNDTGVQITHDGYLKLYQLSQPDLSQRFDCILLDEAQDVNPVIADIVRIQHIRKVAVGDRHQQIYRFRGAEDALNAPWMEGAETHYLTQSFRFGPAVAHVANIILSYKGETRKLQGLGFKTLVKKALPPDLAHKTFIHRTVIGVIENALSLVPARPQIHWVGGIDSYSLRDLEDLYLFSRGRRDEVQNRKLLRDYRDFPQYMEIAEVSQDSEMLRSIKIISTYPDLPQRIQALRARTVDNELDATVTLTTAHKAKGLEWDFVALYEDFGADPLSPDLAPGRRDDELNLLYVAVTRAMKILAINSMVLSIMQRYVEARAPGELRPTAVD
ncbi:UvrD-helicase domain-containing protein [Azotobacter vinelandii]|uniref:UvrD-helicase domain-containing protein n=1 Tax=Azotobacter vinelandii TaxID=354 RepID=UPI002666152B|nr:UvrD-helicase domain-containing protein [Azotobacter vinelandii]WKN20564.1 UvrD-helicase domain-containing protein [Azotobacter vinelandii]WKN23157.1 UvrD-helicase domain-containing protein [Azotobacter vinelandii]